MNIEQLRAALAEARANMQTLIDAAKAENRSLTDDEGARFDQLEAEIKTARTNLARAETAEAEERAASEARTAEEARQAQAAEARQQLGLGDGGGNGITHVGGEHIYRQGGDHRYFQDLASQAVGMQGRNYWAASARLARHAREVEIDARDNPNTRQAQILRDMEGRGGMDEETRTGLTTSVGSGGTLLPPSYLLDMLIQYPRQSRVVADLIRKFDLPKGPMTIEIPKITGPTLVASQSTQNTAVTEQDITDAYITAPVNTLAGAQIISLQAVEQSAVPFDEIVAADLQMSLDLDIETQVVNGSGSSGQFTGIINVSGITTVTFTSGSPTGSLAWGFVGQAKAKVYDSLFRAANAIVMTPDRWAWFETQLDSNNRPLVLPNANAFNPQASTTNTLVNGPTPVGSMFGLPVYVDAVIPANTGSGTNQDVILVLSLKDLYFWESAAVSRALPQTLGNQLSILLQTYMFGAFMGNRLPGAIAQIAGTGLTTPTFS